MIFVDLGGTLVAVPTNTIYRNGDERYCIYFTTATRLLINALLYLTLSAKRRELNDVEDATYSYTYYLGFSAQYIILYSIK